MWLHELLNRVTRGPGKTAAEPRTDGASAPLPAPALAAWSPPSTPPQGLRGLQYPVLRLLEGMLQADHRQRKSGYGVELGDLREYQPGDEVRRIEWNVTARIGVPHVRLEQEERELTLWFLLDRSPSMAFGTAARTKAQLAVEACLALAAAAQQRGDSVGAMVHHGRQVLERELVWPAGCGPSDQGVTVVPPGGTRRHLLAVLAALDREAPPGPLSWADFLHNAAQRLRRRSLVFVVSDFLAETGWEEPLRLLAARHEVVALWVGDPREADLPDVGVVELLDAERGERCWIDTGDPQVRERYRLSAAQRQAEIERTLGRLGVELFPLCTEEEPIPALLRFISLKKHARCSSNRL